MTGKRRRENEDGYISSNDASQTQYLEFVIRRGAKKFWLETKQNDVKSTATFVWNKIVVSVYGILVFAKHMLEERFKQEMDDSASKKGIGHY